MSSTIKIGTKKGYKISLLGFPLILMQFEHDYNSMRTTEFIMLQRCYNSSILLTECKNTEIDINIRL